MLKVATQYSVARNKDGQRRKAEDVAQDLQEQMLNHGKTMLTGGATKPDDSAGLEGLQAWLATCTEDTFTDTPPLKRLKTAVAVCTLPPGERRRVEVQNLCGPQEWNVMQKVRGVKRNASQLHTALVEKVITEGCIWRK